MDANPYAPPKAAVADVPAPTGLKRRRVITMFAFVVLTLGIYYLVWFFRRRTALNQLNSPRKLRLWPLLAFTADFVLEIGFTLAAGDETIEVAFGAPVAMLLTLVRLAVGIVMIWQCFIIKDIIEDHVAPADAGLQPMFVERVKLSGLATFFFSIFYLQYAINRYIIARR
ncbi:MAG TPA: DUF4234 domain-containing protein [Vicinamibacterales bacterium]|nr:DUF4234 domain-containing protein [Vicinamibacterales bacterium]